VSFSSRDIIQTNLLPQKRLTQERNLDNNKYLADRKNMQHMLAGKSPILSLYQGGGMS